MKKSTLVIFCLLSIVIYAQKTSATFGNKTLNAEIILENGETKNGLLKDFQTKKYVEWDGMNLISIEKALQYETKQFRFIEKSSNKEETVDISSIKSIIILNNDNSDRIRYDKMKLKTINSNYEVVDLKKTVILPLEQEGKLSLYGITFYSVGNGTKHQTTMFIPYLKNKNDEYAYLPFDINRMNFFNLGKLEGKFKKALQETTKDCPSFQNNIDVVMKNFDKSNKQDWKKQYYEKEDQKKQIRKEVKNQNTAEYLQIKIDADYMRKPYLDLVNAYNQKCNN